ncbi:EpsG family protein [Clostridium thermarum]|uniref:EpsG family protein n=1 Tax=Clostridium thermarum TaxID=1716543 RepID=UPI00111CFD97|nr:EpsG family protein [Clostridium thermarum]
MKEIYLVSMFLIYITSLFMSNNKVKPRKVYKLTAIIVFVVLFIISGFRSTASIGDTYFYSHSYRLLVENPYLNISSKDYGFNIFMYLLTRLSSDPQILLIVTSFITNAYITLTLYKHSKPFELGVFLYFGTVMFYITMNGIRQSMVAAILFWASKYILKRDWKKYFPIVIILSGFHSSAIIFLLIYFLCTREAWGREFWVTLGASLLLVIMFRPMLNVAVKAIESTSYSDYGKDMMTNTTSVNPIRVLVTLVPLVVAYMVKDKIKKSWPEGNMFIFMSLFNFIFMLSGTQYLFFYRMCIYFDLYNLVLLPKLLDYYDKKTRAILYGSILILYSIFCWYQISGWDDYYRNILFT